MITGHERAEDDVATAIPNENSRDPAPPSSAASNRSGSSKAGLSARA